MKYRLFCALELSPDLLTQLTEVQAQFKAALPRGSVRWARPAGMHVTLKFYGDVAAARVPELEAGLARAAAASQPLLLTVRGLGVFPNPAQPQVIWAGLVGDLAPIEQLVTAIEVEGQALGFAPERRAFKPHLTLGRVRANLRPADLVTLQDYVQQAQQQTLGTLRADALSLMASELRPMGAVYDRLFAVPLGPAPATTA
jgi:RNA 2',3'-cyclic 3'-phosphodiesterase